MNLQESGEMYLETILVLNEKNGRCRSIDIADYMGFSKPSVSRAVNLLKNAEYITVDSGGYITLSETGREIAEKIYERHRIIRKALETIGVDYETADKDACRIEHVISDETFEKIKEHITK